MAEHILYYSGNSDVAIINGLQEKMNIAPLVNRWGGGTNIMVNRGEEYVLEPENPDSPTITFNEDGFYIRNFDADTLDNEGDPTVVTKIRSQASGLLDGWQKVDVDFSHPKIERDEYTYSVSYPLQGFNVDEVWIQFTSSSNYILDKRILIENQTQANLFVKSNDSERTYNCGPADGVMLQFKYYKEVQLEAWYYSPDPNYPDGRDYFLRSGNTNTFYKAEVEFTPFGISSFWGGCSVISGVSGYYVCGARDVEDFAVTGKTWNTNGETKLCTFLDMRYNPAGTSTKSMIVFTSNIPNDPWRLYASSYTAGDTNILVWLGDDQGNIKQYGNTEPGEGDGNNVYNAWGMQFSYFDGTLTPTTLTRYEEYQEIGITNIYPAVAFEEKHQKVFYNIGYEYTERTWEFPKFWQVNYPNPHIWSKSEMGTTFDEYFPECEAFFSRKKPMKVHLYSHYQPGKPAEGVEYPANGATNFMYIGTIDNTKPIKGVDGETLYKVYSLGCEDGYVKYENGTLYSGPVVTCH